MLNTTGLLYSVDACNTLLNTNSSTIVVVTHNVKYDNSMTTSYCSGWKNFGPFDVIFTQELTGNVNNFLNCNQGFKGDIKSFYADEKSTGLPADRGNPTGIFYNEKRFELLLEGSDVRVVGDDQFAPNHMYGYRHLQTVRLKDRHSKRTFTFTNFHGPLGVNTQGRTERLQALFNDKLTLADRVGKVLEEKFKAFPNDSFVFGGDMNEDFNCGKYCLENSVKQHVAKVSGMSVGVENQWDMLFFKGEQVDLLSSQIGGTYGSDHLAKKIVLGLTNIQPTKIDYKDSICHMQPGCDWKGADIRTEKDGGSKENCYKKCKNEVADCQKVSWWNGNCYFKTNVAIPIKKDNSVFCASIDNDDGDDDDDDHDDDHDDDDKTPIENPIKENDVMKGGCDWKGENLGGIGVSDDGNPSNCISKCSKHSSRKCSKVAWAFGRCYFKDDTATLQTDGVESTISCSQPFNVNDKPISIKNPILKNTVMTPGCDWGGANLDGHGISADGKGASYCIELCLKHKSGKCKNVAFFNNMCYFKNDKAVYKTANSATFCSKSSTSAAAVFKSGCDYGSSRLPFKVNLTKKECVQFCADNGDNCSKVAWVEVDKDKGNCYQKTADADDREAGPKTWCTKIN
eukprot:Pgem_evm1s12050